MKFRFNQKYTQIAVYAVIVIVISGFLLTSVQAIPNLSEIAGKILTVLTPLIWGGGIAYILNPAVELFRFKIFRKWSEKADTEKKKNFIRNISVLIVFVLALGLVTGLVFLIVPQLSTSIKGLIDKFDEYIGNLTGWFNNLFVEYPQLGELLKNPVSQIEQYIMDSWTDISKSLVNLGTAVGGNVLGLIMGLKDFIIGIVFAVYFLLAKDKLKSQAKRIFFALFKNSVTQKILHVTRRTNDVFIHYVISVLVDAFIIGCATFIFTALAKMPYAILITVIVAVTNIILFFGPFLGAIPSAFLIFLVDPVKTLWFLIFILILQQLDGNIIKPLLYGESMGLPAIWVLISIIVTGGIFGIAGMLLGVPVFSIIYMLAKEFLDARLQSKNLPCNGALYNRDDIDKFVDGYEYTEEERKKDEKWLESLKTPEKERNFFRRKGGK